MLAAGEREKAYKLVNRYMKRPAEELYDSQQDPYELTNLVDSEQYSGIKKRLSEELDRWMKEQNDPGAALDTQKSLNQSNAAQKKSETKLLVIDDGVSKRTKKGGYLAGGLAD